MEITTGRAIHLNKSELFSLQSGQRLKYLTDHVLRALPDFDSEYLERLFTQYYCLQVPCQRAFRLNYYDGDVLLYEVDGPSRGGLKYLLGPSVRSLYAKRFVLDSRSKMLELARKFDFARDRKIFYLRRPFATHYACIRDENFAKILAEDFSKFLS